MKHEFDVIIGLFAFRDIEFFINVAEALKKDSGCRVGFISFYQAGVKQVEDAGYFCLDMHGLAANQDVVVDIEQIKQLESEIGIQAIQDLFPHDIKCLHKSEGYLREKALKYHKILKVFFDNHSVKQVVVELGGFLSHQILYYTARQYSIDHYIIEPSFFKGGFLCSKNTLMCDTSALPAPTESSLKKYEEYKKEYNSKRFVNIPKKDAHHFSKLSLKRIFSSDNAAKLARKIKNKYFKKQNEEFDDISGVIRTIFSRYIKNIFFKKLYKPVQDEKYVYYPLHVPLDVQILVRCPLFTNQHMIIEMISRFLPSEYKLYVKEHPACVGAYPWSDAKTLSKLENVKLIKPDTNSYELIQNADLVVTINSKVGAEALMQHKNVMVLGEAFYSHHGLTYDLESLNSLPKGLREALSFEYGESAVADFYASIHEKSHEGELYENNKENLQKIVRFFNEAVLK